MKSKAMKQHRAIDSVQGIGMATFYNEQETEDCNFIVRLGRSVSLLQQELSLQNVADNEPQHRQIIMEAAERFRQRGRSL